MEEKTYAGISGPLTVFGRKVEMLMHRHQCTGIGINQIRDDLGAMWAGAVKTPGGKGWKHYCSCRMQFSKGKYIDEDGNDFNSKAESPALNYEYGIDYLKDLVDVAIKYGIINKSGAWFSIVEPGTGEQITKLQGIANVYKYLEDPNNERSLTMIEDFVDSQISI